jgi:hypothetical protein
MYDEIIVGDYAVDLVVEESVIVELKAIKAVADVHRNASTTFGRRACRSACCSTSATRAWRSSASCWACEALVLSAFIGG